MLSHNTSNALHLNSLAEFHMVINQKEQSCILGSRTPKTRKIILDRKMLCAYYQDTEKLEIVFKVFLIESCLALNLSPILSLARLFYTFSMTVTISFPHHYSFFYIQNDSVEKWVTNGCKNVTTFISSSLTYAHLKALKTNSTCNKAWNIFKFNVGLRAKDSSPHKYEFASDVYLCRRFD